MVTTQLEKLHKKPHVATSGTGTPCRVHVLHYQIEKNNLQRRGKKTHARRKHYGKAKKAKKGGGGGNPVGTLAKKTKQTVTASRGMGRRVEARFSVCRECRVTATSRALSLHADMNTSAPWDTRSHQPLLSFASVSHSPSEILKAHYLNRNI